MKSTATATDTYVLLYVDKSGEVKTSTGVVTSSTGSLVKRIDNADKLLDTSVLTPGIYTFVIQTEKENATFRILKK